VAIVDPGYGNQSLSSELAAIVALRLANAEVLPYDYVAFATELAGLWREQRPEIVSLLGSGHVATAADADPSLGAPRALDAALDSLAAAARRLDAARERYLTGAPIPLRTRAANAELRVVERELTREAGLVGRPWNRNLVFSTDDRNGYANLALPSISEARIAGDAARVASETADFAERVNAAAERLDAAAAALAP
jgi:N-acetylated-alpha-linked acidic dipeptidase